MSIIESMTKYIAEHPWEFCAGLLSFFLSLATLWIAIKIHKDFASNHMVSKQIDHVCELIKYLNKSKIEISFSTITEERGTASSGNAILYNIFELGRYDVSDYSGSNNKYDEEVVLFNSETSQIIDVKKYIDHPLTPRTIADELIRFHNPLGKVIKREDSNLQIRNFVEIKTPIWKDNFMFTGIKNGDLIEPSSITFSSWLNLKETAKSLKIVIGNYLIENGIHDNNIREDFKTSSD